MAILSALLSLLAKKVGDILQALFGWSITALFGRLPSKQQMALTVALVLSLLWPLFLVGTIFPAAAAWAIAFLPLQTWLGAAALRAIWISLAVVAPAIVGAITHWVTPSKNTRGGVLRALFGGYPLALGYATSFLVTVITVPLVKLASLARGWSEEHVYVQPSEGEYTNVLRELATACAFAGITPSIQTVPLPMSLSTKAIKLFARGVVAPIVPDEPRMLKAEGLEIYLYPADLLLRGKAAKVAKVRSAMTKTALERHAYLVASPEAQRIQNEIHRLWDVAARLGDPSKVAEPARGRVQDVYDELEKLDVPFEEWAMLERMIRRVERIFQGGQGLIDEHASTGADGRRRTASEPDAGRISGERAITVTSKGGLEQLGVAALLKEALDGTGDLVRVEVELAKDEVKQELGAAKSALLGYVIAVAAACVALALFGVALVLALGASVTVALIAASTFVVIAGVAAALATSALPTKPMQESMDRVEEDVEQIKERAA